MDKKELLPFFILLKNIREDNDMSQADASSKLGISRDALGRYERGERIPQVDFLCMYCNLFNVSADYMLGRSSIQNPTQVNIGLTKIKDDHSETINKLNSLDPDLRFKAEGYIDSLLEQQKERQKQTQTQEA